MKIVAHRGFSECFPENSIIGFEKAIEAGTDAIECDFQFDAKGVPYLLHDFSLLRTAGLNKNITELSEQELRDVSVHEAQRFSTKHKPTPLSKLADLVDLLKLHSEVILFAEIKSESLGHIERSVCVEKLRSIFEPIHDQVVMISFDKPVLELARSMAGFSIGWVLREFSASSLEQVSKLKPESVICDKLKIPKDYLFHSSPYSWMIYDSVDKHEAQDFVDRGVEWIETWDVSALR